MEIRLACPNDISDILKIQSANLAWNLTDQERANGFLSAEFTSKQLDEIAKEIALLVADDEGQVVGYLCAYSCQYAKQFTILEVMIRTFERIHYKGRSLSSYSSFIYGPVCVDLPYRGRGLLNQLYDQLQQTVSGKFEIGIAFVSQDNPYSLSAHVSGLKMVQADTFEFKGRNYDILVFDTHSRT